MTECAPRDVFDCFLENVLSGNPSWGGFSPFGSEVIMCGTEAKSDSNDFDYHRAVASSRLKVHTGGSTTQNESRHAHHEQLGKARNDIGCYISSISLLFC